MRKTVATKFFATKLHVILVAITITTITGCATTSNITPEYVSPNNYKNYDCFQLNNEYKRISTYIKNTQTQKFNLSSTGVNIGLHGNKNGIYPTINFGVGKSNVQKTSEGELSRLYGENDAIIQSARMSGCHFANDLKLFGENK